MKYIIAAAFVVLGLVGIGEAEFAHDWQLNVVEAIAAVACAFIAGFTIADKGPPQPSAPTVRVRVFYDRGAGAGDRQLRMDVTAEQLALMRTFTGKPLYFGDWELHFTVEPSPAEAKAMDDQFNGGGP